MTRCEGEDNINKDEDDDLFSVFDTPAPLGESSASSTAITLPSATDGAAGEASPGALHRAWGLNAGGKSVSITEALSRATPAAAAPASIMSAVYASSHGESSDVAVGGAQQGAKPKTTLVKEPNSGINISRPTKSCEQLPVVLAQHPFATFKEVYRTLPVAVAEGTQSSSSSSSSSSSVTIVGAVIRKTDPKQKNGRHTYGVICLWDMRGPFPSETEELPILFCGSAFDTHYTKLANGLVLALSGLQRIEARKGPSQIASSSSTAGGVTTVVSGASNLSGSQLLKVTRNEQVRLLGYASDLGTCQGLQHSTRERCSSIVNTGVSKFCRYHVLNLRQEARGRVQTTPVQPRSTISSATVCSASTVSAGRIAPMNFTRLNPASVVVPKSSLQMLARHQQGFLTVKGSCGLPTTSPATSDVTSAGDAYAGVNAGHALPVTNLSQSTSRFLGRTPSELGVTARGRVVLAAAVNEEKKKESQRLLRLAMQPKEAGVKRAREEVTKATHEAAMVRAQYGPITSRRDTTAFAPMRSAGFEEVLHRGQNYGERVVTQRADGTASAIVSAVQRQVQGSDILLKQAAALTRKQSEEQGNGGSERADAPAQAQASSLLGMVADSMQSANDSLRGIDEQQRFEQRMERRLLQDKALEVLAGVTEQMVKALYCRQCDRWYLRRNERCKMLQHVLEARETTRRFIECEHCHYKTSVLGDVRPSKLIPRCPRCCADVVWCASNAAPEISTSREDVPPPS